MTRLKRFIAVNRLPFLVLAFYLLLQGLLLVFYPQSERPGYAHVIGWDTFGYYLYLPAIFIYHDLQHLQFIPAIMSNYHLSDYFYQAWPGPKGNYVLSYPVGMAILYSPFFFVGHVAAKLLGYKPDGFSAPYQYAIFIGGIFYSMLGLVFTVRNLRYFFSVRLTAVLLFILLFATNYFYYAVFENAMPHNYLFTGAAILIYLTIRWHQTPRLVYGVLIGLLIGLLTIIRPTEILWCIVPLTWGVYNRESLFNKLQLLKLNRQSVFILFIATFAIGSIQLLYWKISSGQFLYYSYNSGGFDFLHPHLAHGLFSFRKGWLLYTPVMILALLGIPVLYRKNKEVFFPMLLFISLVIYVSFSWKIWWYGGSFGQRTMIQSYALLLIPMGALLKTISTRYLLKWLALAFIVTAALLNSFQTWQYLDGLWSPDGLSQYQYRLTFLKTKIERADIAKYFQLEEAPVNPIDSVVAYDEDFSGTNPHVSFINNEPIPFGGFNYISIECLAKFENSGQNYGQFSYMVININESGGRSFKHKAFPLQPFIGNEVINKESDITGVPGVWDNIVFYLKVPKEMTGKVSFYINNEGRDIVYVKHLRLTFLKGCNAFKSQIKNR